MTDELHCRNCGAVLNINDICDDDGQYTDDDLFCDNYCRHEYYKLAEADRRNDVEREVRIFRT